MTIGTNLRHLREARGLTQEQVADKMDVTFQAVSAWERDEYKPDIDKLIRLAELYIPQKGLLQGSFRRRLYRLLFR